MSDKITDPRVTATLQMIQRNKDPDEELFAYRLAGELSRQADSNRLAEIRGQNLARFLETTRSVVVAVVAAGALAFGAHLFFSTVEDKETWFKQGHAAGYEKGQQAAAESFKQREADLREEARVSREQATACHANKEAFVTSARKLAEACGAKE